MIESPQDNKVKVPATPRRGADLSTEEEKVSLGGKSGSGVISSPSSPKLGGKDGAK